MVWRLLLTGAAVVLVALAFICYSCPECRTRHAVAEALHAAGLGGPGDVCR